MREKGRARGREGGREGKERKEVKKGKGRKKEKKQIPPATIQTAPYISSALPKPQPQLYVGPSHWRFSRLASSIASGPAVEQGHGKKKKKTDEERVRQRDGGVEARFRGYSGVPLSSFSKYIEGDGL